MSLIEIKKKLLMAQQGGVDVSELFNTSLWTGNGAARTITTGIDSGEGSLVWVKDRTVGFNNYLTDTVRGASNSLITNETQPNVVASSVTAFNSSGYELGTSPNVNYLDALFVGWQFRRAENFFDIVQYTGNGVAGRQIAHSLGVKPGMLVVKRIDSTAGWQVYHQSRTATQYGVLNSTAVFVTASTRWNNTEPTSTNFTVGSDSTVNASGGTYIAYLFAHDTAADGIIQCGSYVGNGSATGPVVNLGWRPQYLMIKGAAATGDWQMIDASRGFTSANDQILLANTSGVETSANLVNADPTGFQLASTSSNVNTNGQTYIYMAIREAI